MPGIDIHQQTAVDLALTPTAWCVRIAEHGDIAHPVVDHGHSVEVTAIVGGVRGDEVWPPHHIEALRRGIPAQAGHPGIQEVERTILAVLHLVDIDAAGDMLIFLHIQCIQRGRLGREPAGHVHARIETNRIAHPHRKPTLAQGDPHRLLDRAIVRVDHATARPQQYQLVRLVGAQAKRDAGFREDACETFGMRTLEIRGGVCCCRCGVLIAHGLS